jgi:hypothetical protein
LTPSASRERRRRAARGKAAARNRSKPGRSIGPASWGAGGRRWLHRLRGAAGGLRIAAGVAVVLALSLAVNGIYQAIRKPSELLFPVSGTLAKTPSETWASYAPLFRRYATASIPPELLASLAQVEAGGNPVVRTYWRWSWKSSPLDVYRPASSSVGMYQMTDATFAEARKFCIRDHRVVAATGAVPGDDCAGGSLYFRVLPRDAVELTSAYLDRHVTLALTGSRAPASALQRRHLAAMIHLCGAGAGSLYVRRGFRLAPGQRCGDHDPRDYLARVDGLDREFAGLASRD